MVFKKQAHSSGVESNEHLKWFKDHYCYEIDPLVKSYLSRQDRRTDVAVPTRPTDASKANFLPVPEIFFSSDIEVFSEPTRQFLPLESKGDLPLMGSASLLELRPKDQPSRVELNRQSHDSIIVINSPVVHKMHEPEPRNSPSRTVNLDSYPPRELSSQVSESMSCATTVSAHAADNLEQLKAQKASISEQICDLIELSGDEQLLQELRERRRALDQKIVRLTSNEQVTQPTSNR